MNILILGASGFIGTNLALSLACNGNNLTLFGRDNENLKKSLGYTVLNISFQEGNFDLNCNFEELTKNIDILYHLVSTTVPAISNQKIGEELTANVIVTTRLLDACIKNKVKKVVFFSSGGAVYGQSQSIPIREKTLPYPISAYGIQKLTIENLLYLYDYLYGLDYRIIRLSNPYGPYQRPNGIQGAVTNFIYKTLKNEPITIFGDGTIIRDYIYIEDAIIGIANIVGTNSIDKTFNLGSGVGVSINELLDLIHNALELKSNIIYRPGRKADVPINVLDISRYEKTFGKLKLNNLSSGIKKTRDFISENYL